MAAVLLSFALAVAAVSLAANAIALLGHRAAFSEGPVRERLAPAVVVRAFLAEWLATTLGLILWPFGLFPLPRRASGEARGLVILLPEAGSNRSAFWLLRRRLRRGGWRTVDASMRRWLERPDLGRSDLDAHVRAAGEVAPGAPLILLAHGAAGLAARDYLRATPEARVRQLVTLGTPHQGSTAPVYRFFSAELHPEAERILRLGDADPVPDRIDVVTISSRFDSWIVPSAAADCPGAFNVEVRAVGHFQLLVSRQVWQLIAENLAAGDQDRR